MLTTVYDRLQPQFTFRALTFVNMTTLLQRLREACGENILPAHLAKACGVSRTAAGKWFDGGDIKAENVFPIADHCGVEPRWLALGKGPKKPPPRLRPELSDEALELAGLYDRLTPQLRQNVMDLVHTLTVPNAGGGTA